MRLFLITLLLPVLALADAVIFSGNDVKALKQNLDLFGVVKVLSGSLDPSAGGGVVAPQGSIYLSTTNGLYEKTGAAATAWTKVGLLPIDLTTDVTGILPVANGGTGLDGSSAANGSLLIGNNSGFTLSTLTGTANQVSVTNGAGSITLALPQDIATSSDPSFNSVTVTDTDYGTMNIGQTIARAASTGVVSGGILSIDVDPTKFDLNQTAVVVVNNTDPLNPTRASALCGPFDAQTVTNLGTQPVTYILLDTSCTITQQSNYPTPAERRAKAFVGRINHSNLTSISFVNSIAEFIPGIINQNYDLLDALGPFNITGNIISANGANLSFNKSAGSIFQRSINLATSNQNPHTSTTPGTTPTTFRYVTQTTTAGSDVTVLDPTNYDVGGTVTAVPGPTNTATVQRIYLFASNNVRVLYGQATYATLAAAVQGYASENFIVNPAVDGFAVLIGFVAIQKNCTSLLDLTCSKILLAPRFAQGAGGGGGTGGTTTLQQAYLNSILPQIVLNSTQSSMVIADASTPIGADLLSVRNNAGTTEFMTVDVNGVSTTNFVGTGTTGAVRVHNLTTAQKNALTPALGMVVYDTDIGQLQCYDGSWGACTREVQSSDLTLTAGDQIAIGLFKNQTYRVAGNTANSIITIDDTPFGTSAPIDGLEITLIASDTDQPIELIYADVAKGCLLNGDALLTFGRTMTLKYNASLDRYVEKARNF